MEKSKNKKSYKYILSEVVGMVKSACERDERWKYHVFPVVRYGKLLASKLRADKEVVELSCWLHDLTRIRGDVKNHHITSSIEAEKILKALGYDDEKIYKVRGCIYAHRGSVKVVKKNIEEEIVACADSMAHFEFAIILFYSAFGRKKLSLEDGTEWISAKIERSWKKISIPMAKRVVEKRYRELKYILSYKKEKEVSQ